MAGELGLEVGEALVDAARLVAHAGDARPVRVTQRGHTHPAPGLTVQCLKMSKESQIL